MKSLVLKCFPQYTHVLHVKQDMTPQHLLLTEAQTVQVMALLVQPPPSCTLLSQLIKEAAVDVEFHQLDHQDRLEPMDNLAMTALQETTEKTARQALYRHHKDNNTPDAKSARKLKPVHQERLARKDLEEIQEPQEKLLTEAYADRLDHPDPLDLQENQALTVNLESQANQEPFAQSKESQARQALPEKTAHADSQEPPEKTVSREALDRKARQETMDKTAAMENQALQDKLAHKETKVTEALAITVHHHAQLQVIRRRREVNSSSLFSTTLPSFLLFFVLVGNGLCVKQRVLYPITQIMFLFGAKAAKFPNIVTPTSCTLIWF